MGSRGKVAFSLLPVIVLGGLVLGSMVVMLMLFIFSGLVSSPVSLVVLTLSGGVALLAGALFAASFSRGRGRRDDK